MMKKKLPEIEHSAISNPELTGAGSMGVNLHEVQYCIRKPAIRSRIATGKYKMGFTRLSNGDILAAICYWFWQDGKEEKEHTIYDPRLWRMDIMRSKDDGRTWSKVDTKGDLLVGKEPALQELSDGRLILCTSHPHGFHISTSDDSGITWKMTQIGPYCSNDELMKYEDGAFEYGTIRNVLEEKDGRLSAWMIKYKPEDWRKYYKKEIKRFSDIYSEVCLFTSGDRGASWEETDRKFYWTGIHGSWQEELQVMRHSDGRLMAFMRVGWDHKIDDIRMIDDIPSCIGEESGDHMVLMESTDNGISWGEPHTVTNYGEPHGHLLELSDGRLLCTYCNYHQPRGIYAILSEDGGKTWDTDHYTQLALSINEHLGWPTSVQLSGGDILTGYTVTAYEKLKEDVQFQKGWVDECVRWQVPEKG